MSSTSSAPETGTTFDRAAAVERTGEASWTGNIPDGWDMGGVPNGGFLVSLAVGALAEATGRPDPVAVTSQFVAPSTTGDVDVQVDVLRAGGRHHTASASVLQGGREVARLLATLGDLDLPDEHRTWAAAPPALPPREECIRAAPVEGVAFRPPPITEQVELWIHPRDAGFAVGAPSGTPTMAGWARFADGRDPDTRALPLFADAFPPTVFNAGLPVSWTPTIELSVQVRGRPAPGWLRCLFRTRWLRGGYHEEDGEVWDSAGSLVALSRQLALTPRQRAGA